MREKTNLTEGNITQQLIAIALPLIWGNLLQQLYNTVDAYIVGRYIGQTAFGAIGVAGSVMNLFIFVLNGACNGVSVIFGTLYGQKNWDKLRQESFLSMAFGLSITLAVSFVSIIALEPLLLALQTPQEVLAYAQEYLKVIFLGLFVTYLYNWCASVLRAVGNTRAALWGLVLAMLMNLVLDYVFVVHFHMGIMGTAVATVISQLFSVVVCLTYIRIRHPELLFTRKDIAMDRELLKETANYSFVFALHQSSIYIGKLLVQGAVNTGGTEVITAFSATQRIEGLANAFSNSNATAISVFVAQNRGAQKPERIRDGFYRGTKLTILCGLCISMIMPLLDTFITKLLVPGVGDVVLYHTHRYIALISVFYTLCYIGNAFVGLYRGIGLVKAPVVGTVVHISLRVIFSYLLVSRMGLAAVALATGIGWITVVLVHGTIYLTRVRKPLNAGQLTFQLHK